MKDKTNYFIIAIIIIVIIAGFIAVYQSRQRAIAGQAFAMKLAPVSRMMVMRPQITKFKLLPLVEPNVKSAEFDNINLGTSSYVASFSMTIKDYPEAVMSSFIDSDKDGHINTYPNIDYAGYDPVVLNDYDKNLLDTKFATAKTNADGFIDELYDAMKWGVVQITTYDSNFTPIPGNQNHPNVNTCERSSDYYADDEYFYFKFENHPLFDNYNEGYFRLVMHPYTTTGKCKLVALDYATPDDVTGPQKVEINPTVHIQASVLETDYNKGELVGLLEQFAHDGYMNGHIICTATSNSDTCSAYGMACSCTPSGGACSGTCF